MTVDMKDSDIEWIGPIPSNWQLMKVKYVADIQNGSDPKTEGDIPVYGSGSDSFRSCGEFKEGPAVLIGRKGATLHIPHFISGRYWNVDTAFDVKTKPNFDIRWFYYQALCFEYRYYISQTTLPSMTQSNYENMLIATPAYDEQRRIAAFLDTECAKIDNVLAQTRASIEEYKKLKQAVITQAVTKGVRGEREMKDSGNDIIGTIPRDWDVWKVKFGVTKVGSGKTPSGGADAYTSEGILFLRSQNVYDDGLRIDPPTFISEETDADMANTRVLANDVLLNITGASIGRCCVYPKNMGPANVNQHVSIIRVIPEVFLPEFMHYYWVSDYGKTAISLYQTGGNREGMSAEAIKNSPIMHMSIEEQQEIVDYLYARCKDIEALISKKESFITELENYKKSLIYEYVTGKKEVPQA